MDIGVQGAGIEVRERKKAGRETGKEEEEKKSKKEGREEYKWEKRVQEMRGRFGVQLGLGGKH